MKGKSCLTNVSHFSVNVIDRVDEGNTYLAFQREFDNFADKSLVHGLRVCGILGG